jgi:hypothetical protein
LSDRQLNSVAEWQAAIAAQRGCDMSMELWVFSDKQLNSISEWQHAIDAEDYPLKLIQGVQFENLKGFLPAQLRGEMCGFECYWDNADALMRGSPDVNLGHAWKFALALRWMGSSPNELRAAWMAGTAYARATDGMIFDDQRESSAIQRRRAKSFRRLSGIGPIPIGWSIRFHETSNSERIVKIRPDFRQLSL